MEPDHNNSIGKEKGEEEDNGGCALNRDMQHNENTCTAVVLYRDSPCTELSWEADSNWSLRMLTLMVECARLKMLMAWCSTLGGAHSSLGECSLSHAEQAGAISGQQLSLAVGLGDPLMAARCKLYLAFSFLQQRKLKPANKIIRDQYRYITKEAIVKDEKLVSMCLAAWERLQLLRGARRLVHSQRTASLEHSHDDINT